MRLLALLLLLLATPAFAGSPLSPTTGSTPLSPAVASAGALPTLTGNQVVGVATGTSAVALTMPSCSGATNGLIWTTGTGFGCNTLSGAVSVTPGSSNVVINPNPGLTTFSVGITNPLNQKGTTTPYTVLSTDMGQTVTHSKTTAVAEALPQAGTTGFASGVGYAELNLGAGVVTITPTTSTIGAGAATIALAKGAWCFLVSDGTNWPGLCGTSGSVDGVNPINTGSIQIAGVTVFSIPSADNVSGSIAIGSGALGGMAASFTWENIAIGNGALAAGMSNGTGNSNVAVGYRAQQSTTTGASNTSIGTVAGKTITTGSNNVTVGTCAFNGNSTVCSASGTAITGSNNTAIGTVAMQKSVGAVANNTAIGENAMNANTTGSNNTVLGYSVASATLTTGTGNILIGVDSSTDVASGSTSNTFQIKGISGGTAPIVCTGLNGTPTCNHQGTFQINGTQLASTPGTGLSATGATLNSNAIYQVSFQPGLITSITNTKSVYAKVSKASTVDNIEGSASAFSCVSNPTITMYECGTDASCASPTTIGSATVTAAGQAFDGTVSSAAITAGDYIAWAISAGTCTSLDISATAQVHSN